MLFSSILYFIGIIGLGFFSVYGIMNGEKGVGAIVAFFIIWTLAGAGLLAKRSLKLKFKTLPEQTAVVKVIGKATKLSGGDYVAGDDGSGTASYTTSVTTSYFISFEFSDGARKSFPVDVKQYNSVTESETGTLTYKEHKNDLMFIDFKSIK